MKMMKGITKITTEYVLLSLGLIALIFHSYIIPMPLHIQMVILLTFVFLIGVPHGALDFLVDEQNEELVKRTFSIKKFVSVYLTRLFAFSLFWFMPWVAFSLFMVFSIYHFGETDMSSIMKPNKTSTVLYIAYGSLIFAVLLLSHLSEIGASIPIVGGFLNGTTFYVFLERYSNLIIIVLALFFILVVYSLHRKGEIIKIRFSQVIQFSTLLLVISLLPLLLAFTFYFALWHSILSVRNIFSYFKNFNNSKKFTVFCNKSILFSLLALGSIVGLYFALDYFIPDMNLLFALLIVLSVLTLPHLAVMHRMYKNFSRNKLA
jgi:beta-carotene 15,15'-dioxygenase